MGISLGISLGRSPREGRRCVYQSSRCKRGAGPGIDHMNSQLNSRSPGPGCEVYMGHMSDRWLPSGRVAQVRRYVGSGSGPVHAWSCMEGCGCGFWATLCPPGAAHEPRFLVGWWPSGGRWLWTQQPAFSRLPGPGSSGTIPASSVRKKPVARRRQAVIGALS